MNMPSIKTIIKRVLARDPECKPHIERIGSFVRFGSQLFRESEIRRIEISETEGSCSIKVSTMDGGIFDINFHSVSDAANRDLLFSVLSQLTASQAGRTGFVRTVRAHKWKLAIAGVLLAFLFWPSPDQPTMPAVSLDGINQPQAFEIETPETKRIRETLGGLSSPISPTEYQRQKDGSWKPKLITPEVKIEPLDCDKSK